MNQQMLAASQALFGRYLQRFQLRGEARARGSVSVVMRYSDLYPNSKLRGEVHKFIELGSNLVVTQGREMSAALWAGGSNAGLFSANRGYSEATAPNSGWVVRGMALGKDDTAEDDGDTALADAIINPALGTAGSYYHPIDLITFTPAVPSDRTKIVFARTFAPTEPTAADALIKEFGLYTAAPASFPDGVVTDPVGPAGGPFLVARKTHGLITKTADFTMQLLWTIEF